MPTSRKDIAESLSSKTYRHKLVSEHLQRSPPAQIRSMREERGWTQRQLGDLAGAKQNWISHIESPDYEGFSLSTLKKLAFAFDVALVVRFIPFSQFVDWIANLEMRDLAPLGYDDDRALSEPVSNATRPLMLHPETTVPNYQPPLPMEDLMPPNVVPLRPRYIDRGQQSATAGKVQVYAS